jgi:ABC-type dipeptide/oligopeptide/nickel transport system permease subunit
MSAADAVAVTSPRARRRRLLRRRFLRRPLAVVSLVVILVFVAVALFAPYIAPYRAAETDFDTLLAHPSWQHLFGTDELGRDVFSRLVWGARVSITVGFLATALSMLIAVPVGLLAGYYRGWLDTIVGRVADVLLAFPFVILAIGLAAIMGPSLTTTTIALGVAAVPGLIRITRGETLALREADFVPAAVASGAGDATIVFRHILPNMASTLLVWATVHIPRAIIGEATLSFLGLGVRPPGASWGRMLHDAQSYLSQAPRLAVYPGLTIVLVALAFNLLGDALRDVFDPRTTR